MDNDKLRVTVISDLHCKHTSSDLDENKNSRRSTILYSDSLRVASPLHPVHALMVALKGQAAEELKSDVLLCPGDITDKIDPQGFITGWSFLEEIRDEIRADKLYATIGNHDVDSRRTSSGDPFTVAKSIKGNFPIADESLKNEFWQEKFCVIEDEKYVLLIYNSSHSHISANDAGKSGIDIEVIAKMKAKCSILPKKKIKIALCHHHPISQSNTSSPDSDIMNNGEKFLDMLSECGFSIVIHGHKHETKIRYYNDVVVFCAGSFSSRENISETESDNVFHVIYFNDEGNGVIKTWYYGSSSGWHIKGSKKFPPLTGFGFRGSMEDLALDIANWFNGKGTGNELYANLTKEVPNIQFLMPDGQEKVKQKLADKYEIEITYDDSGLPKKISKLLK